MNIEEIIPRKKTIQARKNTAYPVSYPRTLMSAMCHKYPMRYR